MEKYANVRNRGTKSSERTEFRYGRKAEYEKTKKMTFYRVLQEITDKRNVEGEIVVVDPKCDKLNK